MIHAWIDRVLGVREVHGPRFRERMAAINAAQSSFVVSLRHSFPLPQETARWMASCPRCGRSAPYRRRRRGLACRPCCERFHAGRWDASCLLQFEPGPSLSA
jgi:hypothetical protein